MRNIITRTFLNVSRVLSSKLGLEGGIKPLSLISFGLNFNTKKDRLSCLSKNRSLSKKKSKWYDRTQNNDIQHDNDIQHNIKLNVVSLIVD